MNYTRWSFEEVNLLKELYPKFRPRDLVDKFPIRNYKTIVIKALTLGLQSAYIWQPEENKILKDFFANSSKVDLLRLLPKRSWTAIMAQGERIGFKRERNRPRLPINEVYFKHWSSGMAYVLGFILADGCIIRGTYKGYSDSLKFGVQLRDIDILEKIRKELSSGHKISINKNAAHFSIMCQKIVDDLKELGISYRKSLNEQVPLIPKKFQKDFIRGIFDGDGGVRIDKKGCPVVYVCGGLKAMQFIRNHFLERLQVYSKIGKRTYSKLYKNFLCDIVYKSNSALKILSYLYEGGNNLYLERKYAIAVRCLRMKIRKRENINRRSPDD